MATQQNGWAVLGPGSIARTFLRDLAASSGTLVAVGSSDPGRAAAFAEEAARSGSADVTAGTYEEALADPRVSAVYVATVHTGHARLVLAALEAGKAVLCEKPLAVNHGTAMALVDAARQAGLPLVEAFVYRFHPQTAALLELIRDGAIGTVQHIDAAYAFRKEEREGRLFDAATAGGGILDVGCYPLTFVSAVVAAATGVPVAEPAQLSGSGTIGPTGADEWAVADLVYPGGVTATIRTGVRVQDANTATILGSRGRIHLPLPYAVGDSPTIEVATVDEPRRSLTFPVEAPYAFEADATLDALRAGEVEAPGMTLDESLATARTLDRWRDAIGLRYPFEAEDADIPTVSGRPLSARDGVDMPYGELPGVGKRMSRLVMGCDNQPDLAHASALFDFFIEHGGNAFDTAWLYGGGAYERRLGRWIANRGIRDDVVVIMKGAHTPHCDPESIGRQLAESLERQGTDYADLYLMHRDDPGVPVGEFVDALDEQRRAGRVRVYGVSNWTPERFDEANAYARANGRFELRVLSNHFGLAEAYDVPWAGCRHATDPASKRWLEERQVPLLPWSSQARGSSPVLGRTSAATPNSCAATTATTTSSGCGGRRRSVPSSASPPRPSRSRSSSRSRSPTFPLFGPRSIAEARSSIQGVGISLSPDQVAWLDLRT